MKKKFSISKKISFFLNIFIPVKINVIGIKNAISPTDCKKNQKYNSHEILKNFLFLYL